MILYTCIEHFIPDIQLASNLALYFSYNAFHLRCDLHVLCTVQRDYILASAA